MARQTVDWKPAIAAWQYAYANGEYVFTASEAMSETELHSQFHYLSNVRRHLAGKPLVNAQVLSQIATCTLRRDGRKLHIVRRDSSTDRTAIRNEIFTQLAQQKLASDSILR